MKQVILFALLLISTQMFAQRKAERAHPAYGAVTTQFSSFNGNGAIFAGAYGGWLINHKLLIGAGGYGLATRHKGYGLNAKTGEQNYYRMGYGGLVVEYKFYETRKAHFTVSTLVGGGILKNGHGNGSVANPTGDELKDIDASGFYVVQPSVNIEWSVTDWFRLGAGAGYRFIGGVDQPGITNASMSARTLNITAKFGLF